MCGVKPGSILDPVNLLSLCFGYCSPLVQWDCNRYNVTKVLKKVLDTFCSSYLRYQGRC